MNFSSWKKSLSDAVTTAAGAASAAVSKAAEVAKDVADDSYAIAIGAKCLRDYRMGQHVSTGGPHNVWKVYSAANRNPAAVYPEVSVWVLDKKVVMDQHKGLKPKAFEPFFNQQKKDCNQLKVLRHPGILRLIEPLEETRNQLVFVTEPILGSLSCVLSHFAAIPTAPSSSVTLTLSPLEAKLGLLHLAETLHFLHHEAHLAHCALSPESVYLTLDGGWKLSNFAHAAAADYGSPNEGVAAFEYTLNDEPCEELMKPPIGYVAPELVSGSAELGPVTPAVDMFSLGAVAYELVVGRPALPAHSVQEYKARIAALGPVLDLPSVPSSFQATLHAMLSPSAAPRPTASAFLSSPFFLEDQLLRALRFLDSILQREPSQKAAFLRDLATLWPQIDLRLLRHKVLPPLLQELKSEATQLAAFPVVLAIAQQQGAEEFMARTLPQLRPIFQTASGEMLLLLVRSSAIFASLMSMEAVGSCMLPMFERAVEGNNSRLQEEVLRNLAQMADDLPYPILKEMMPKVTGICLRTTSAGVRASACALMARLVPRLNREDSDSMLDIITQVTAVDRTPGTLAATTSVCDAISKQHGADLTAAKIIPLLAPSLLAPNLSVPQFTQICRTLREMVDRVEAKRLPELERKAPVTPAAAAAAAAANGTGKEASWDTPLRPSSTPLPMHQSASNSSLGSSAPTTPSAKPPPTPAPSWSSAPDLFPLNNLAHPPSFTPQSTTTTTPTPAAPSWTSTDPFSISKPPSAPVPAPAAVPAYPAPSSSPAPPNPSWDWISPTTASSPPRTTPIQPPAPRPPRQPQPRPSTRPVSNPPQYPPMPSTAAPSPPHVTGQPLPDLFGGLSVSPPTHHPTGTSANPLSQSQPTAPPSWDAGFMSGPPSTSSSSTFPMGSLSMGGAPNMGPTFGGAPSAGPSMEGLSMGGLTMGGPSMGGSSMGGSVRPSYGSSAMKPPGMGSGIASPGSGDMFGGLSVGGGADPFGSLAGGGGAAGAVSTGSTGGADPFSALAARGAVRPPMPQGGVGVRPPGGQMGGPRPMGMRPPQPPGPAFGDSLI